MNTPDTRLDELFVRYWDNALTDGEAAELDRLLVSDPAAREWFRTLSLQAVTAAEVSSVHRLAEAENTAIAGQAAAPRVSRRRVFGYAGGALAASVAVIGGWRLWGGASVAQARVTAVRGDVKISTASGVTPARTGSVIPPGATVITDGMNSAAALVCPEGTGMSLAGDTALSVAEGGKRVMLVRGHATADIRPRDGVPPLELATIAALVTAPTGALVMMGHAARATEVVVADGAVNVFDAAAAKLAVVGAGEMITVQTGARCRKHATPVTPDDFVFDMARPLPEDWHVGKRVETADGPVLVPERCYDPYHGTEMWQIRSDKQWARGFYRLYPDSTFHVKYRVDKAGPGQVIACVRAPRLPDAETAVVECNGAFENARPGEWQWLRVKAADMLDNKHAPKFPAPWVGFLLIVNTYKEDLGLKIADYRVTRPGAEWPGA